jgi:NADPH:quinone reductase-like Zn-dependent oxidoreductase
MRAFVLDELDAPPALRTDVPTPTPGAGDVLVRVRASSINPVDLAIIAGRLTAIADHEFPVVIGRDFAGVVEQTGADVAAFATGDRVYGFLPAANPTVHAGSWAETILLPGAQFATRIPDGVTLEIAGAAPLAAITAIAAVDSLELSPGQTVVVIGATGGVGSVALQLAARAGARVIAPARATDETYLRELGVSQVIDRDRDLAEQLPDAEIDALLDLVSYTPEDFDKHAAALKPGGRAASTAQAAGEGPGRTNVNAGAAIAENLERLSTLLSNGAIKIPIQRSHSIDDAPAALQEFAASHKHGKHAITID